MSTPRLVEVILELQRLGCHNLNFVTPTHQVLRSCGRCPWRSTGPSPPASSRLQLRWLRVCGDAASPKWGHSIFTCRISSMPMPRRQSAIPVWWTIRNGLAQPSTRCTGK